MNGKMLIEIEEAINKICEKYNKEVDSFFDEEIDDKIVLSLDIFDKLNLDYEEEEEQK